MTTIRGSFFSPLALDEHHICPQLPFGELAGGTVVAAVPRSDPACEAISSGILRKVRAVVWGEKFCCKGNCLYIAQGEFVIVYEQPIACADKCQC